MRRTEIEALLPLRETLMQVLLALSGGELHGYAIKQDVEARTSGAVKMGPGTLYETLQRAELRGLVEEVARPAGEAEHAQRRYYGLTRLGRAVLEAEVKRLSEVVEVARSRLRGVRGEGA